MRELPLDPEARLTLLREMLESPQPDRVRLELMAELAGLLHASCEQAYQQKQWQQALEHHDALLNLVDQLAGIMPEQSEVFWGRYGELLAFFTAAVHAAVSTISEDPPPQPLRAELCWWLALRLERAAALPVTPPEWLAVLEQQLVQDGALFWRDWLDQGAGPRELAEPDGPLHRALHLLLRLQTLLAPAPEWVHQAAADLQLRRIASCLALDPGSGQSEALRQLLVDLEAWPVESGRRDALGDALGRARLALELLAPELGPLVPAEPAVTEPSAPGEASAGGPDNASSEAVLASMTLLEEGAAAGEAAMELGPVLSASFEQIEDLLEEFIWHLPKGSRALPAALSLPMALEPHWRQGRRLAPEALERLTVLGAAWQRRLAPRMEPLPTVEWQHGVLVELRGVELAVLHALLASPDELSAALAELRREHHNRAFWEQRQEHPWMQCPSPLEALRRLHREEGFYAGGHEPLNSLLTWGRQAVQALREAEPWTDDAGCLGLWLALDQALTLRGDGPLPALGAPPEPDALLAGLAGQEVLYVGDQAAGVLERHRGGGLFRGGPFGLRVLETPASRWPQRPAAGFEASLEALLAAVDALYRQRPFAVLLADCGAYRLPLLRAVHQRYGVAALSSGLPMAHWLGPG